MASVSEVSIASIPAVVIVTLKAAIKREAWRFQLNVHLHHYLPPTRPAPVLMQEQ